jgi:TPR repeat protein
MIMLALQWEGRCRKHLASALVVAAALYTVAGPAFGAGDSAVTWEAADTAYEQQKFAVALDGYEKLAAQGDARAAELAGQMHYYAGALYGKAVVQDLRKAETWLKQAASAGRETARPLLVRISARNAVRPAPAAIHETPYVIGPHGC